MPVVLRWYGGCGPGSLVLSVSMLEFVLFLLVVFLPDCPVWRFWFLSAFSSLWVFCSLFSFLAPAFPVTVS